MQNTILENDVRNDLFKESPVLYATSDFKKQASFDATELYLEARRDRIGFWEAQAQNLDWFSPWHTVLEWEAPYAKWFQGGSLNVSYNCLDRHIKGEKKNKAAIIWEAECGKTRTLTYWDLYREVNKCANVLLSLGVKKGDTVALYLPMIPEAIVAMLACSRIGAVHTVVFAGFSSDALKERILDCQAKLVITSDAGIRRGTTLRLKDTVDDAVAACRCVQDVLVVKHCDYGVTMHEGRDHWYHEHMLNAESYCPPAEMEAEERLFILYTSGTTGRPKGIVHTTGGYLLGATMTTRWVFDVQPHDVYWCTADVGWITGHTYVVYGPLSNGMTQVIYEGALDWPKRDRTFRLIEKHGVTILYTAPTAIRTFMKWGTEFPESADLSSLRLLATVGEPINPEAWMWYYTHIGNKRCPVVDTWWQTETGSIMIAPLAVATPLKPGSATFSLPGIEAQVLDDAGHTVQSGLLAITEPWPSMLRGIHNDSERYENSYWKKWDNTYYFTGDGAVKDADGYFWLLGRVDDVINVSGHRIGTMEVESALVDYPSVAEAAVVAISHSIKGQAIVCFVTLKEGFEPKDDLERTLKEHVVKKIGAIARPERIIYTRDLPKTRSGKIMRRLLRDIGEGRVLGDVTTLADVSIVDELKHTYDEE